MENPYAPPRAVVQDIADPNATHSPAERGTRLGAAILDGLILAAMVSLPVLFGTIVGALLMRTDANGGGTVMIAGLGLGALGFIVWAVMTVRAVQRNGQSLGKKLLGIKVIRRGGEPVSLGRVFWLRNFVNGVIGIVPLYGMVDVLFIFGESRQCLHDRLADTIVVKA
jgi:uncharacterized RDD family membrane protein YckC